MFGYVLPDKPNMFIKDYTVYKAFYCGLCKSIGKKCGQVMRFSTNYDINFLNILYHSLFEVDIQFSNEACILNPIKKKSVVKDDELTQMIIDVNNILGHYKFVDDVLDNKSILKLIVDKLVLNKHYKKSKRNLPVIDRIIKNGYDDLRRLEGCNESSIDKAAHPFANIMKEISEELFKDKYTESIGDLMYALGKWVYIMDAIDDIDEDFKENNFNVFLSNYKYSTREKFLKDKYDDLKFILDNCYGVMCDSFDNINIKRYEGILTNIIWYGIKYYSEDVLRRNKKCKKIHM